MESNVVLPNLLKARLVKSLKVHSIAQTGMIWIRPVCLVSDILSLPRLGELQVFSLICLLR